MTDRRATVDGTDWRRILRQPVGDQIRELLELRGVSPPRGSTTTDRVGRSDVRTRDVLSLAVPPICVEDVEATLYQRAVSGASDTAGRSACAR